MPNVLLADNHAGIRRCVRNILESREGWEVCAEAATGRQAVELTAATRPDIVVLDLSMPELNGLQAAEQIHERFPEILMVILTGHDTPELSDVSKAVGVRICISKANLYELDETLDTVWQQVQKHPKETRPIFRNSAVPAKA